MFDQVLLFTNPIGNMEICQTTFTRTYLNQLLALNYSCPMNGSQILKNIEAPLMEGNIFIFYFACVNF